MLVALLPILAFAVFLIVRANWTEHATVEAQMAQRVRDISDAIDREVEQQIRILETLALSTALDRSDLTAFHDESNRVLTPNDNWFGIFLADPQTGRQVLSTLVPIGKALPISGDIESVFVTARTRQPQVLSRVTERGAVSGRPIIGVRVPVIRDDDVRWVLSAGLKTSILQQVMRTQKTPPQWIAAVLNTDGRIMSRSRRTEDFIGKLATADLRDAIARNDFGIFTATTQEGTEVYTLFTRSPVTGWITVLGVPAAELEPLTRRPLLALIAGATASLLIAIALAVALNRLFTQRRAAFEQASLADAREAHLHELQMALAEKDVLLREVHHRVKNNLQVIASLLRIQGRSMAPETQLLVQDSVRRISAMGRIHEQLYRSERIAKIELSAYLKALAADLASSHAAAKRSIDCHVEADRIVIDLDTATPLGLILTEVISNAFKHAFPNDKPGEVIITAKARAGAFVVTVADNGVGMPSDDMPPRVSIGMELIARLSKQIGASTSVRSDNGAVFEITIPNP